MEDQPDRQGLPVRLGDQLDQVWFDPHRIGLLAQAQALTQPPHVGVQRDPGVDPKGMGKHHAGGLAGHPRELQQLLILAGTAPPWWSCRSLALATMFLALLRKRSNRAGVIRFTRLSVHWADSMVATSSSQGVRQSREQVVWG